MQNCGQLWAIVLAAGSGERLEPFLRRQGYQRPIKQFCAIIGRRTMLQHTWKRVEMIVPREQVLTVVDLKHRDTFRSQLASRSSRTVIGQPANRETAPGTLLPLAHVLRADPEALVAVFPSDHFILEEQRFMLYVELAQWTVRRRTEEIVILGVAPDRPDPDYGWIELKRAGRLTHSWLLPVEHLWEKPDASTAQALHEGGHVWSTMVTVAKAATLWHFICDAQPHLQRPFERIRDAIGTAAETAETNSVYAGLRRASLSADVFARNPSRLSALRVRDVHWSDWGREERIKETLLQLGKYHEVDTESWSAAALAYQ